MFQAYSSTMHFLKEFFEILTNAVLHRVGQLLRPSTFKQRRIQNPVRHLRWSFFSQNAPFQMFENVLNTSVLMVHEIHQLVSILAITGGLLQLFTKDYQFIQEYRFLIKVVQVFEAVLRFTSLRIVMHVVSFFCSSAVCQRKK